MPVRTGERLAATVALLQRNSLFARCSTEELEQLAATAYPMSFEPGDMLCTEGGESPECYIIEEGHAVVTIGRKGVATVGEHDVVGERGVLLDTVRSATVTAMTHMITYAISRERLRALVAGNARGARMDAGGDAPALSEPRLSQMHDLDTGRSHRISSRHVWDARSLVLRAAIG